MELSEEAKAEVQAAFKIFREDHVIRNLKEIRAHIGLDKKDLPKDDLPKDDPPNDPPKDGDPPPPKDDPPEPPAKAGLWWGTRK